MQILSVLKIPNTPPTSVGGILTREIAVPTEKFKYLNVVPTCIKSKWRLLLKKKFTGMSIIILLKGIETKQQAK